MISRVSELELRRLVDRLGELSDLQRQPGAAEHFERGVRQADIREVYICMSVILGRKK